jgi:predicted phosphodiesterase
VNIAVISDLHLGPGDRSDRFGHDDESFLKFLHYLEDNFERIVLLGDIWETLTTAFPFDAIAGLRAAREAHRGIARRFEGERYTYVHGNHDLVASREGIADELVLEADGARLLFTHGHHHDLLIRNARWLSELGVWLGGWLLRMRMSWLYRAFENLDHHRGLDEPEGAAMAFQKWAIDAATLREADIVVTGHTHVPLKAEHGSRLFLNSGSCTQGGYSFLALDTRAGRYGVHGSW